MGRLGDIFYSSPPRFLNPIPVIVGYIRALHLVGNFSERCRHVRIGGRQGHTDLPKLAAFQQRKGLPLGRNRSNDDVIDRAYPDCLLKDGPQTSLSRHAVSAQ